MKKILFAAMAMTAMLASCSKNAENVTTEPKSGIQPQVQITLDAEAQSRAFFDNTAAAEAWEKEITSLTIHVFDKDGNIIARRSMTAAEITAKSALFSLPNSAAGTNCTFYVVANADYGNTVLSTAAMDLLIESATPADYNGTFAQTATGRKRTAGFVMTGKTTTAIAAPGSATTVGVTIKRVVAKIAVRAKLADNFTTLYNGGKVIINNAKLKQANDFSYSFANAGGVYAGTSLYTHTQASNTSGTEYQNMFYAYERASGGLDATKYQIELTGIFDADGNTATTGDQSDVEYTITLDGAGSGQIKRNGYYRIDATIKGLSGTNALTVNFTVAEWETPVTQSVELGI